VARLRQTLGGRYGRPLTHSSYTTTGDTTAVTTQNLVRVGADTEIGYLRAKMMNDLLKLQYGLLVLLFRCIS
jgi:hypothetical protein